ncbi:MAG: flagellar hook-basal body complex protein FliE [Chromatiales bacterium]|nr:flagellar hook-basal body complex protein FliE [Chromatiales bacterium]
MSDMEINKVLSQMRALSSQVAPVSRPPEPGAPEFGKLMQSAISQVNQQQMQANKLMTGFETGTGDASLAEVMVAMQKSSLSFQAMTEVRNRLIEAYQEIMNMPV